MTLCLSPVALTSFPPRATSLASMASKKMQRLEADLANTQAALEDVLHRYTTKQTSPHKAFNSAPNLGTHTLFLFVGPRPELITFHSDLLPEKTRAYLTARAGVQPFQQLPDECPNIVNLYRLFLYTGTIFSISNEDKDEMDMAEHNNGASFDAERTKLMECYILGVHLHDERFRNAAIDALIQKVEEEEEYPTGLAADVYRCTVFGDKLRKLIVDFHVWKGQGEWLRFPHEDSEGPAEFIAEVAAAMKKAGAAVRWENVQMPWKVALCMRYHEHIHSQGCIETIDLSEED